MGLPIVTFHFNKQKKLVILNEVLSFGSFAPPGMKLCTAAFTETSYGVKMRFCVSLLSRRLNGHEKKAFFGATFICVVLLPNYSMTHTF